jgi:hypothetical protein
MTAGSSAFYSIRAYAAAAIAGALLVSAPASAQGISDKLNDWFFGKPAPEQRPPGEAEELECPGVEVRQGASTLAINAPTGEATPMNARYQVSIGQLARECKALGGTMTMRIGVQGRILLGPAVRDRSTFRCASQSCRRGQNPSRFSASSLGFRSRCSRARPRSRSLTSNRT